MPDIIALANFVTGDYITTTANPDTFAASFHNTTADPVTFDANGMQLNPTNAGVPSFTGSLPAFVTGGNFLNDFEDLYNAGDGFTLIVGYVPQMDGEQVCVPIGSDFMDINRGFSGETDLLLNTFANTMTGNVANGSLAKWALVYDPVNGAITWSFNGSPNAVIGGVTNTPQSGLQGQFFGSGVGGPGLNFSFSYIALYPREIDITLLPSLSGPGNPPPDIPGPSNPTPQIPIINVPHNNALWR